jgi:hypothetical protein
MLSAPAASWPEAAAKARYVLKLYAAGLPPLRKHDLVLEKFNMALPSPTLARKSFGLNELFAASGMKSSLRARSCRALAWASFAISSWD